MRFLTVFIPGLALLLTGCASTDSENVETAGIYADYSVTSDGSTSAAVAQLKVGGALSNTVLELSGSDLLTADNGIGLIEIMTKETNILGDIQYVANFDPGASGGTQQTITFTRTGEIIYSHATLPADFAITSPAPNAVFTSADTLTISWDVASTLTTHIRLSGACGNYSTSEEANVTHTVILLSAVQPVDPPVTGCSLNVTLTRSATVPVDAAFGEGGEFKTSQVRSVPIDFTF